MLKPAECLVGPISAATGLTLVLPRADYERRVLIVSHEEKLRAICLDGVGGVPEFASFACDDDDNWQGLLVPNVSIELDETSLCDSDGRHAPIGAAVRKADKLTINTRSMSTHNTWPTATVVMDGLPPCSHHLSAGFQRWEIVLGAGDARRVLHRVDVSHVG